MSAMSMLYSMLLNFEKSEYWYDELKKYKNSVRGPKQREALCQIAYLDVSLPGRGSVNILQLIKDCYFLLSEESISVPELSVTSNLPSLMNGGKDFCDWSKHDIEIAATATLIRQYCSNGDIEGAKELLISFEATAHREGLHKLFPNIEAMKCRLALYSNDMNMVEEWMNNAPNENSMFISLDRYINLTKIRCYIASEKHSKAFSLIESMRYYAERCDRKYICMELDILRSIILYRENSEWKSGFVMALEKICEYRFIPIIAKEGAAVLNLLRECADRCSDNKKINKAWFERVITETGKIARFYPMYLKESAKDCSSLQPIDVRILSCLADGLSIQETAEALNIKFETLRSRVKEIYRKLGAKNKTEAVMNARSLKLI
ncbi:MAG: LuxR C-terminal-related transcriptional regulator [Oscillospiraceae bacterium]